MVSREQALEHFNNDKDYEDKLAYDINWYLTDNVDNLPELTLDEKEKIKVYLRIILEDSQRHSFMFTELIEYVIKNGKNNY